MDHIISDTTTQLSLVAQTPINNWQMNGYGWIFKLNFTYKKKKSVGGLNFALESQFAGLCLKTKQSLSVLQDLLSGMKQVT